ncbi:MAG TPA: EcsC family protein [Bacillales bacterium]|nr:EcsC family protein [Bacillales bacterium]
MDYEQHILKECRDWQHEIMKKRSTLFGRAGKSVQNKINEKIPQKVHDIVTESIKGMVQSMLYGSDFLTRRGPIFDMPLEEREERVENKIVNYRRTATAEGAGTGFGGLWWGLADFPMLLSIKMKFLYDTAGLYGFDVKDYRERLFLLYIFQVAFSSDDKRIEAFLKLRNWPDSVQTYTSLKELDWQQFQQEYRDYIDLAKLLQLVPGLGAIVGGIANYRFLGHLGETAMNAYRMRILDFED